VKVGDLVRDFPDEIDRFTPRIGVVVKVGEVPTRWGNPVDVWFGSEIEEWEEDEIEVINESR